jgi:hypothetical protein
MDQLPGHHQGSGSGSGSEVKPIQRRGDGTVQALDEDQEGDDLDHRIIFEEDRDFNQGKAP